MAPALRAAARGAAAVGASAIGSETMRLAPREPAMAPLRLLQRPHVRQRRTAQRLQVVSALERGDNPTLRMGPCDLDDGPGRPTEILFGEVLAAVGAAQWVAFVGVEAGRDENQFRVEGVHLIHQPLAHL